MPIEKENLLDTKQPRLSRREPEIRQCLAPLIRKVTVGKKGRIRRALPNLGPKIPVAEEGMHGELLS